MGAAEQLPPSKPRWVNTLHLRSDGFCPQCGVATTQYITLPRIVAGKVTAEWRGCEDCREELRAEMKAKRGARR